MVLKGASYRKPAYVPCTFCYFAACPIKKEANIILVCLASEKKKLTRVDEPGQRSMIKTVLLHHRPIC